MNDELPSLTTIFDNFILLLQKGDFKLSPFLLLGFFILISSFFSASEIALFKIQNYQLQNKNGNIRKKYKLLNKLLLNKENILSTILIGNNISNVLSSIYGSYLFTTLLIKLGFSENFGVTFSGIILIVLILFWGEVIPKNIAVFNSLKISFLFSPIIYFFYIALYPVTIIVSFLSNFISKFFGTSDNNPISDDHVLAIVNTGGEMGVFEDNEKSIIKNILNFNKTTANKIMTPRNSVFIMSKDEKISVAKTTIANSGYSRIPIYKDNIDNIVGVIHQKNLFKNLLKKGNKTNIKLEKLATEPTYIHYTTSIFNIFEIFKKEHIHIGIVVDDFGNFNGIITMEDLLEEIVGEIRDEKDTIKNDSSIVKLNKNSWIAKNILDVNSFCRVTEADITEHNKHPYETIQGLIMFHLRRIPKIGDKVVIKNFMFEVQNMVKDQITLIKIEKTNLKEK